MNYRLSALLLAALLAACGGGGSSSGGNEPDPQPVNKAPTIGSVSGETLNGAAIQLNLAEFASDPDGDTLNIKSLGTAEHGSISQSGLVVTYDPADGYAGSDSFSVTVTDGSLDATAQVSITAYQGMKVSGRVVDEPVPGAKVMVTIDGQEFTAVADSEGNYVLEFQTANLNAYIKLEAVGNEEDGTGDVKLVSLLGEVGTLLDEAGEERDLDGGESKTTNITNVTTARYVLAVEANGGEEITSNEEMATAEKSIDADKLLEIAAVIKLLLDNPEYSLPAEVTDVLEFVLDTVSYNEFVEEVTADNPEDNALTQTMEEIVADPELTQGFTQDSVASSYYVTYAAAPGFLSRGGELLELGANGKGQIASAFGITAFDWAVAEGKLVLTFTQPWESYGFYHIDDVLSLEQADQYLQEYGSQVGAVRKTNSLTFTRLVNGSKIDSVSVAAVYDLIYDEVVLNGQPIEMPNLVDASDQSEQLLRDADASAPLEIVPDDLLESWAAYSYYNNAYGLSYAGDLFEFSTGSTGSALISGRSFNWNLQNNTVHIAFNDNTVLEAQKIDSAGELNGLALRTYDNDGKLIAFDYNFGTWHDEADAFTTDNIVNIANHHWATFVNGWPARFWKKGVFDYFEGSGFGFEFKADETVNNVEYWIDDNDEDGDGNTIEIMESRLPGSWEIGNDEILSFTRCPAENCRRREWLALQATDTEIIVLEREFLVEGENEILFIPSRVNIYREWKNPVSQQVMAIGGFRTIVYPSKNLLIGG